MVIKNRWVESAGYSKTTNGKNKALFLVMQRHNMTKSISSKKQAYSLTEVADYFGVSTSSIRLWIKKKPSFPRPFKKFGILRFRRSDIERYESDRRSRPLQKKQDSFPR
ncbi:MAG: hypothetical protein CR984_03640 [Proteobacteria bacterium]|nr:MAG: hypothetical protein CR984_03640 [Pseudomonadota bacterium]PIE67987.1 MAG: hypothetical protein CSA23_01135 [Deltaproteobacteria bacterium]